ncbi:MAG: CaiB/BaiF CoA transferase family protein, partial [Gemmatimonadaceae bacterium]
ADVQTLISLVRDADVVIDNFRPGTLERRGLEVSAILASQPELLWCTITGFGPASSRPGYDFVVQAECGWMAITGEQDGPPMKAGVALADIIAGKDAAIAILGAVAERAVRPLTATERRINISLADSARAALVNVAQNVLVSGVDAKRWGNAHPNLVPYQLFDAADRPLVIAVGSDGQWVACATGLALNDLAEDDALRTNAGRVQNRERVVTAIASRVREMGAHHWLGLLQAAGVPCGLVKSVGETLIETDADARTGVRPSFPGSVRLPPPKLDEHGAAIRRLGWRAFRP